jgi:hypothetical protein
MNRLYVAIALLSLLIFTAAPSPTFAADPAPPQDFDLNACYDRCPCSRGLADHACAVCKQQCEWQSWRHASQKSKKKGQ